MTHPLFWMLLWLLYAEMGLAFQCTVSFEGGPSLYWADRHIELVSSASPGQDLTADQLRDAVAWGAEQWTSDDVLPDADTECSDIKLTLGTVEDEDLRAGYDWHHPEKNRNLIVFRRGGDHDEKDIWFFSRSAIAMTTVTFVRNTGEILDADIELNDRDFLFTDCDPDTDDTCDVNYDIKNTLTHELGHVLGLDHPSLTQASVREATMYGAAPVGDIEKRDIAADDVAGLCTLYPFGQPEAANCTEDPRLSPSDIHVTEVEGCAQSNPTGWGFLCLIILLLRRNKRSSTGRYNALLMLLMVTNVTACFDRSTNTWEQSDVLPVDDKKAEQAKPQPEKAMPGNAFFSSPRVISSPARGRLGVLHLSVAQGHPPLKQLKGTWGKSKVSSMPWDAEKRRWQILFATSVGEKAQEREMVLDGILENGQKVRFAHKFLIDHIIYAQEELQVSKKYISPKRKVKRRVKKERALLKNLWTIDTTRRYWKGNFFRPSMNKTMTGEFGVHRVYNTKKKSRHLGVDWDGRVGDPVLAAQHGRVMMAQSLYYSGNTVVIDHGRGLFTLYFHLSAMMTSAGEMVYRGDTIGEVGATGQVTGPHLHFAAKLENTYVDPLHLLSIDFSQDPAVETEQTNR